MSLGMVIALMRNGIFEILVLSAPVLLTALVVALYLQPAVSPPSP